MKGHWTKEPPTEPGWYKVVLQLERGNVVITKVVRADGDLWARFVGSEKRYYMRAVEYWWSEPEELPELPEGAK